MPLLHTLHDQAGRKGTVVDLSDTGGMAHTLRRWLWKANVRRPELHERGSSTRKPITGHDLRATGLTWMAVRGDDPLKIKQRAGHAAFSRHQSRFGHPRGVRRRGNRHGR